MCVTICQFHFFYKGWIDLWELDFFLWCNTDHLDASTQDKLLDTCSYSISNYDCISIECSSSDSSIEFAPIILHTANDVNDRVGISVFKLDDHVTDGQVLFVDVMHFDEFS
jgi:hypothetical protein